MERHDGSEDVCLDVVVVEAGTGALSGLKRNGGSVNGGVIRYHPAGLAGQ